MVTREELLIYEAMRWVNTKEEPGNRGQIINMFQKTCGTYALNQPYCACFLWYCIKMTEDLFDFINQSNFQKSRLKVTANCVEIYNTAHDFNFLTYPEKGAIVIWQKYQQGRPSTIGHAGLIYRVKDRNNFSTIEANTSVNAAPGEIIREGDGVALKERTSGHMGELAVKGYLKIWS